MTRTVVFTEICFDVTNYLNFLGVWVTGYNMVIFFHRFFPYLPPVVLLHVCVEAGYTWDSHKVAFNERRSLATNQTLGRPQTIHGCFEKGLCFQPCLVSFLSFCLYVCAPSVLPHTESLWWMRLFILDHGALIRSLLLICCLFGATCMRKPKDIKSILQQLAVVWAWCVSQTFKRHSYFEDGLIKMAPVWTH